MAYINGKEVLFAPVNSSGGDASAYQWCGEYQEGINYKKGAIVSFEGNIYLCIKDLDDQQDPTNAEYWEMLNEEAEVIPEYTEVEDFAVIVAAGDVEGELDISYAVSEKVALPAATNTLLKSVTDKNLIARNIKKGVEIFGVTGEYGGGGTSTLTAQGTLKVNKPTKIQVVVPTLTVNAYMEVK